MDRSGYKWLSHILFPIGACTPLVLCPCDVLKCRAQMNRASGHDSSLRYVIRSTYQRQGLKSLLIVSSQ